MPSPWKHSRISTYCAFSSTFVPPSFRRSPLCIYRSFLHARDLDALRKSRQNTAHWSSSHSYHVYNFGSTTQHIVKRRRRRALPLKSRSTNYTVGHFSQPSACRRRRQAPGVRKRFCEASEHSISLSPCLEPHVPLSCVLFMFSTQRRSTTPSSFFTSSLVREQFCSSRHLAVTPHARPSPSSL